MDNASLDLIVKLLPFLIPIAAIEFGLLIAGLVSVLRRKKVSLLPKWGWVLIIVLVNIVGPILYFILGRKDSEEEDEH